jgi:hypothetical protein
MLEAVAIYEVQSVKIARERLVTGPMTLDTAQ